MNYNNYELKIVEEFGVALRGWPDGTVRNPGKLGSRIKVRELLTALLDGSCHWASLDEDELAARVSGNKEKQARGELIYKPRKKAKRPTKARSSNAKSAEYVHDSDEAEAEAGTVAASRETS